MKKIDIFCLFRIGGILKMKKKLLIIIFLLVILLIPNIFALTAIFQMNSTYGWDTYIQESAKTTNSGTLTYFQADSESGKSERTLLFFNLSSLPSSSIIGNATLELYLSSGTGSNFNLSVYRLTANWTETGVNWNTKNGTASWTTLGGDYSSTNYSLFFVNNTAGWKSWNVKQLIQELANNTYTNFGFILIPQVQTGNNFKQFSSRESGANTPKLTIDYVYDVIPPSINSFAENPSNNSAYSPSQTYQFNSTITDNTALSSVWINFNGINYTNGNISNISSVFTFTRNNLAAGTYYYKWYANDTLSNLNSSFLRYYTVTKANPSLIFLANSGTSNLTLTYPQQVNISAINSTGILNLLKDNVDYSASNSVNKTFGVGSYIFKANITGNQNYSDVSNIYYNVTINQASQTATLSINESSPIIFGKNINVTCNGELYRNSVNITNEKSLTKLLGAGNWNYSCQLYGNQNYSYSDNNVTFVVNQASPNLILLSSSGWNYNYGTESIFSCTSSYGEPKLFINNLEVSNPYSSVLSASSYNIKCNISESQNYTSDLASSTLTINKASSQVSLTFDKASPQIYGTSITPACSLVSGTGTPILTLNGNIISSGSSLDLSAGTYDFNCSLAENQNYTKSSNFSQFIINKALPPLSLTATTPIIYGTSTDFIGSGCPNQLTCSLNISNGVYPAGIISVNYSASGNQNYTQASSIFSIIINLGSSITSLVLSPSSPIIYGAESNFSCYNSILPAILYINNIDKTSENNLNILRAAGTYIINCSSIANANYSSSSEQKNYQIDKVAGDVKLYLNSQENNLTIDYPQQYNITAASLYGSITIYKDSIDITSAIGQNITPSRNSGYYNITAISSGDENHSLTSITYWLNVTLDSQSPLLTIDSPQTGASYGYNTGLALNFAVSDAHLDSCWYSLDSLLNISLPSCQNTTFGITGDGSHILYLYANDSLGNLASSTSSFAVLVGSPTIILNSPINIYSNSKNIIFKYTPSDLDLQACELWGNFDGDFILNQTNSNPANNSENSFSLSLSDGVYKWNIRCNDSQAHSSFNGNKTFYIDTISPAITISEPAARKTSRQNIPIAYSINDSSPTACKYNIKWSTGLEVISNTTLASCSSSTFNVSVDGDYILTLYAADYASNSNYSTSSFTVDTSSSPASSSGGGGGGSFSITNQTTGSVDFGSISNMIINPGESKKLALSIKNTGRSFLNSCKISGSGNYSSWISSSELFGLSQGEIHESIITLNVPEKLEPGKYSLELFLGCSELNISKSFIAEMINKKLSVSIVKTERTSSDKLKITYSLEEISGVDQEANISIVLLSSQNQRIAELKDSKSIKANSKQEFVSILTIPSSATGTFNLLININSQYFSTFVQENVLLGKSSISGFSIFGQDASSSFFSIVLIILFLVFAVFIVRRIFRFRKILGHNENIHTTRIKHSIKRVHSFHLPLFLDKLKFSLSRLFSREKPKYLVVKSRNVEVVK